MSYYKRKAIKVRNDMLIDGLKTRAGIKLEPFPITVKKLDKAFSELVRLKGADDDGWCQCVSCAYVGHWKGLDNGHFVDRDHLPTRWDLDNCRPQCPSCNRFKTGRRYEFGMALNRELGPGTAERLIAKGNGPSQQIKDKALELLQDIRLKLKAERKRPFYKADEIMKLVGIEYEEPKEEMKE
jgi:5-methylcytosine-specific restriction endonuclease McrA